MTRRLKRALQVGSSAVFLSLAPLSFSVDEGLAEQQACAQNGTCCPEAESICVIGDTFARDYHYKTEGSCKKQT